MPLHGVCGRVVLHRLPILSLRPILLAMDVWEVGLVPERGVFGLMDIVMPFGSPGTDVLNFNVDSLWSGGPFQADV